MLLRLALAWTKMSRPLWSPLRPRQGKRTDSPLQAMLQGLMNVTLDVRTKIRRVRRLLLRKMKKATILRLLGRNMTEAVLRNQDFIAPVGELVKKETQKPADIELGWGDRRRKFLIVTYSTNSRSASSSNRHSTEISDKRTKKKVYYEMWEKQVPESPPWNNVTAGKSLRRCTMKQEWKLIIPGVRGTEPVNDRFPAAVGYQNYRLLKKWSSYDDDFAHELHKKQKNIAVQAKDRNGFGNTGCRRSHSS